MRTWSTRVVRREAGGRRGTRTLERHGRLAHRPDDGRAHLQGRGLGRALLAHIEAVAAPEATTYLLFTGARSADNIRMYKKAGYRVRTDLEAPPLA